MNRVDVSSASWTPFSQLIRCPPKRGKSITQARDREKEKFNTASAEAGAAWSAATKGLEPAYRTARKSAEATQRRAVEEARRRLDRSLRELAKKRPPPTERERQTASKRAYEISGTAQAKARAAYLKALDEAKTTRDRATEAAKAAYARAMDKANAAYEGARAAYEQARAKARVAEAEAQAARARTSEKARAAFERAKADALPTLRAALLAAYPGPTSNNPKIMDRLLGKHLRECQRLLE